MPPAGRRRRVGHRHTLVVAREIEFAAGATIIVGDRALCGLAAQRPRRSAASNRGSAATEVIVRLQRQVGQEAAAFLLPDLRLHDGPHHTPVDGRGLNVIIQEQAIVVLVSGATEKLTPLTAPRAFLPIVDLVRSCVPLPS